MECVGLVAGGLTRWLSARAQVFIALSLLSLALTGCGSGEGRKRAVECQTVDDCDASTLDVCDTVSCDDNQCVLGTRPDGHRCDDSDPLTGEDACLSGICAGVTRTCDDDLGPCLKAVHDRVTDECTVEPADDDTPCDDADACTQLDTCQAGACVGAKAVTCAASDDCHVDGECDPETGECSVAKAEDGAPCDDGQACTAADVCRDGSCGGEAVTCDDGLSCSIDSCDKKSGACAADMSACTCVKDADCDDGNACNGQETCGAAKLCQAGAAVVCATSSDACLNNVCVAETGACEPEPVSDGAVCDDADACTTSDTCQAGVCKGAEPVVCAPLSQCHLAGTCDKITGACSNPEKPKNSSCNDGNACTATDTCQAGGCVGSALVSCSAADQCHDVGVCDTGTGICSKPTKLNGVKCNDANPCTSGDACQDGACTPTAQVTCTASDSCHTVGSCDVKSGACSNPAKADGTSCSDGLTCTTPDTCLAGKCSGTKVTCDDKVACSIDSCSEKLGGCTSDKSQCACTTSADCNDGNPCNGVETCNLLTLQCQKGTDVSCAGLDDACNVGSCDIATGACVPTLKANGTACDDGNLCTQASSCQAGVCQGTNPLTCAASDQCHDAGACNSATGKCTNPLKKNGVACNDGNACTLSDTCQSGACTGSSPVVCSASDQCHSAGTCDTSSGACSNPAKTNGSACSDGDKCTQTDTCQGGVCSGASPVTCSASDQCHVAGTCDATSGTCSNPTKKDGSGCSDGNACTQSDTCQAGTCTGASPVTCTASDQCHTAGSCDSTSGTCSNPAKKDGTVCNDNNLCTKTDTCLAGTCTGASSVTCTSSDQCHNAGSCDPTTGTCSNPSKPDNTPCGDGKACTSGDKCTKGVCGGTTVTCDDKIACTVDSCVEPSGCNFDTSKCGCTKDADCVNADACDGVETCDLTTLTCKRGTAISCSALDDACNTGTCDSKTGACKATPKTDGTGCDDANACTRSDGCVAGKCVGTSPVTCSASDQCHAVGSCDKTTGVCSNPSATDGSACNDGNKCTQSDTCKTGVCLGASPVVCAASDQCHSVGTCDTATGVCSNPTRTGSCDDGDKCTQTDTCQTGVCKGSNPVVCSAVDQCHDVGACDAKTGNCSNPAKGDGTPCDDSNKCTQSDSCSGGKCTGTKPVTCASLGQCYAVGTCDTQTGACSNPFAPSGTTCDDTDACTTGELCDGKGACSGGNGVACPPPSNLCLTNTCNSTLGCVTNEQPAGTACDDGTACTRVDSCGKGQCIGTNKRANVNADWSDDPGPLANSVDIFTDGKNDAHIVGTYTAGIRFNDKDTKVFKSLALPAAYATGIYWTMYTEAGVIPAAPLTPLNIGGVGFNGQGVPGTLTVIDAAGNKDGSFTLLGMFNGSATFGASVKGGASPITLDIPTDTVFVARYAADGSIVWVAPLLSDAKSSYAVGSLAAYDDGSVIASGSMTAATTFYDSSQKAFAADDRAGVWAARLGADGVGQWASIVVTPGQGGGQAVGAVTTHEDGGATLSGRFTGTVLLGPKSEISVSTSGLRADVDVWYLKLNKVGALAWGGRVGGTGSDWGGDVARIKGGGALLMVNTIGNAVNGSDAKTTQQFLATATAGLQTHIIGIDSGGVMQTDGLIANPEAGLTRGYQLKRDLNGFYGVAGIFATGTSFYSSVGFGTGVPKNAANFKVATVFQGPQTLFVARVDQNSKFSWAVQAGGDNSGMAVAPWDIVMTAHPSHSITLAGMFSANANFGDQVPEPLQVVAGATGNPFVVHVNSEEEYDYCP